MQRIVKPMAKTWSEALAAFRATPQAEALGTFVQEVYQSEHVLPPQSCLYAALEQCPLTETRVVILGQDPYPTPGHAHGLAFSVPSPVAPPPSLRNILREIATDCGAPAQVQGGDLTPWAHQGVLLLNTILTVRAGAPLAHAKRGWEAFTDEVIRVVAETQEHVVFMLWGGKAKAKATFIDPTRHLILTAAHPSPLSAWGGFFGCKHFSAANAYLEAHGRTPIQW